MVWLLPAGFSHVYSEMGAGTQQKGFISLQFDQKSLLKCVNGGVVSKEPNAIKRNLSPQAEVEERL